MSKELTPLQAYKRFADNIRWLQENTSLDGYLLNKRLHLKEDLDTIEIALKDYELLKERTRLDSFECLLRLEEILPRGKELLIPVAKELNALELIIEKRVDVQLLKDSKNLNDYNWCVHTKDRALTQGEYAFLKERC